MNVTNNDIRYFKEKLRNCRCKEGKKRILRQLKLLKDCHRIHKMVGFQ